MLVSRLVGGQCGQDPRSTKVQDLVPLLTCNKDISRHKSSLGLMTGSGVDTEVELILARSSIFSFPSNISDMDISPAYRSSLGIGWRRGLARCRIPAQLSKHDYGSWHKGLFTRARAVESPQRVLKIYPFHEPGLPLCTSIWFTTRLTRVSLFTDENLKIWAIKVTKNRQNPI